MAFKILLLIYLVGVFSTYAQVVADWQQCGGAVWNGGKTCGDKSVCMCVNYYYWQCVPNGAQAPQAGQGCPGSGGSSGGNYGGGNVPVVNQGFSTAYTSAASQATNKPAAGGQASSVPATGGQMASTTHYSESVQGSCGCGNGAAASWETGRSDGYWTIAGTQNLFGASGSWCGSGCGKCFQLTSTGKPASPGMGSPGGAGTSILGMLTNLCPPGGTWCSVPNSFGFNYHFDIFGNPPGWDNPVVSFTEVACPYSLANDYKTCRCQNGVDTQSGQSFS